MIGEMVAVLSQILTEQRPAEKKALTKNIPIFEAHWLPISLQPAAALFRTDVSRTLQVLERTRLITV